MKKMKFATIFIFIFVCLIFIGESFQDLLGSFSPSYAYLSVEKPDNLPEKEMVSELLSKAEKNQVQFFAEKRVRTGMTDAEITIYYSGEAVLTDLSNRFGITERNYPSLFIGDTKAVFTPFYEIDDIDAISQLRLLGTDQAMGQFERDIRHLRSDTDSAGDALSPPGDSLVLLWSIAGLAILFTTIYELLLTKKENYIKISYGERPIHLIVKNILCDTAALAVLFGLAYFSASQITFCGYLIQKSILLFGVIALLNAAVYFSIYRSDIKAAFSSVHMSNKFLLMNYGVKVVTMVLTVCMISSNIALIGEGLSYLKQKTFYTEYKNYSFLTAVEKYDASNEEGPSEQQLSYAFYKELVKQDKVIVQSYLGGESDAIYINKSNQAYLQAQIESLQTKDFTENKLYFMIPESLPDKEAKLALAKENVTHLFRTGPLSEGQYEVLYYPDNTTMLAIENEADSLKSFYLDNPVVFYENVTADALDQFYGKTGEDLARYVVEKNMMFDATQEDLIDFAKAQGYEPSNFYFNSANVLDAFTEQTNKVNHIMYVNFILCLMIFLIEFMIISLIIKMEYTVNAVELTVKRVLGYGMLRRNKNIFLLTLVTSVLSLILALTVNFISKLTQPFFIVLGVMIILVMEIPLIIYNVCKLEKASIQKLLKGGSL